MLGRTQETLVQHVASCANSNTVPCGFGVSAHSLGLGWGLRQRQGCWTWVGLAFENMAPELRGEVHKGVWDSEKRSPEQDLICFPSDFDHLWLDLTLAADESSSAASWQSLWMLKVCWHFAQPKFLLLVKLQLKHVSMGETQPCCGTLSEVCALLKSSSASWGKSEIRGKTHC